MVSYCHPLTPEQVPKTLEGAMIIARSTNKTADFNVVANQMLTLIADCKS